MNSIFRRFIAVAAAVVLAGFARAESFRTVVIDPGHGGHDKGGQWGLVYEKHLALDTAARLESELKKRGFRTVMTRSLVYFVFSLVFVYRLCVVELRVACSHRGG